MHTLCPPQAYQLPEALQQRQERRIDPRLYPRLQDETLFYCFYAMPFDEAQLLAADELTRRGWMYHKDTKTWVQRAED